MGFVALHSAHYSKTFQAVVGGPGHLKGGWRENHPPEKEEIVVTAPWHPIAQGINNFTLEQEEYPDGKTSLECTKISMDGFKAVLKELGH